MTKRGLTEDEELRKLLEESSDEEVGSRNTLLGESDDDLSDEDVIISDHDSDSEQEHSELDSSEETDDENCEYFTGKDKITRWRKSAYSTKSKTKQHNIIESTPGPTTYAKGITSEIDAFMKLIDIGIIDDIVKYTNIYIQNLRDRVGYSRDRDSKLTCRSEIMAVLGLLFLFGSKKARHTNVLDLWTSDGTGMQILRAVMSYKRFLFLLRCFRFDEPQLQNERRKTDKLAAIRSVLDPFISNCKTCYDMSEYVTIDEMLLPYRGHCSFIQYIPSKPAKYGIKMFALCDANTFYTTNLEVYCGKQPPGQYEVSNSPEDVVKRLVCPIENSNRNLTTDNWYTDFALADYLLEKKITLVGTIKKNKKELPTEFLPDKKKEVGKTLFGFQKNKTLVSYVPRKNRSVILLSTMHDLPTIDATTKKPEIIMNYNNTKGAVHTVDKMCASYSVSRITKRWPLLVFFTFLNIAGINAQVLLSFVAPKGSQRRRGTFLKTLALDLMKEHLIQRAQIPTLPSDVFTFLSKYRPTPDENEKADGNYPPKKRGTCCMCRRKKNSSTTMKCDKCTRFICKNHAKKQILCVECDVVLFA